jgi:hypothetical protein
VVWSFVYFAFGRVVEMMMLRSRSRCRESKQIEILVLRHELEILRRQHPRPRLEPTERARCRSVPLTRRRRGPRPGPAVSPTRVPSSEAHASACIANLSGNAVGPADDRPITAVPGATIDGSSDRYPRRSRNPVTPKSQ